jgi:hypothetical protein
MCCTTRYYTILYYTALCCTILQCTVLYCTQLHYNILHSTALHCIDTYLARVPLAEDWFALCVGVVQEVLKIVAIHIRSAEYHTLTGLRKRGVGER